MVNPVSTRAIVPDGDLAADAESFARRLRAVDGDRLPRSWSGCSHPVAMSGDE